LAGGWDGGVEVGGPAVDVVAPEDVGEEYGVEFGLLELLC